MELSGTRARDEGSWNGFAVMTVFAAVALTWVQLSPSRGGTHSPAEPRLAPCISGRMCAQAWYPAVLSASVFVPPSTVISWRAGLHLTCVCVMSGTDPAHHWSSGCWGIFAKWAEDGF